jgi:tRNA (guanine-N7-)-methyltransferase
VTDDDESQKDWRNFYGRIRGKTMRAAQKEYLEEDLGHWRMAGVRRDENPERRPVDPAALFGARPVWLEVGFGGGEHLVAMAARYPDVFLIGCEVFVNGVAMLLGKIRDADVRNLALHPGDVRDLMDVLPDACIAPPPALRDGRASAASAPRDAARGRVPRRDRYSGLCPPDAERGAEGRFRPDRAERRSLG